MSLRIRALKDTDYDDILVGWWKDWGWQPPEKDFLPDAATSGLMVMDKDIPVVAGFFYHTNAKVGWVDWIISNKQYRENRKESIILLLDSLTLAAKNMGYLYTYALVKHNGLVEHYKELGYTQADRYNSELIKKL